MRDRARYEVTAELTASTSVQEFAKVFEGLHALARKGAVRLRIQPSHERGPARIMRLSIRDQSGARSVAAIDIADDPAMPAGFDLGRVHVLFKRSYVVGALGALRQGDRARILPFGLNNPAIGSGAALQVLRGRVRTKRTGLELACDARQLLALPAPSAFEIPPEAPAQPHVLFQTRLWPTETPDPGVEQINEERAELIRTLRRTFRHRFLGGAIPTEFVRTHYPDVATTLPFSMRAYPRLLRTPLIGIYTRGLRDSLAFKFCEYLAASRCIVAHKPATVLANPLVEGENYLAFATPETCLAQCEALLSRPADAAAMRQANSDYYRATAEPAALMQSLLERAIHSCSPRPPLG